MESRLVAALARKGADLPAIAAQVIRRPEAVSELVAGLEAPSANVKYGCEKVLRRVSEQRPDLVLPHFDVFVKLLRSDNSFLKWGAIITLGNLAPVMAASSGSSPSTSSPSPGPNWSRRAIPCRAPRRSRVPGRSSCRVSSSRS